MVILNWLGGNKKHFQKCLLGRHPLKMTNIFLLASVKPHIIIDVLIYNFKVQEPKYINITVLMLKHLFFPEKNIFED